MLKVMQVNWEMLAEDPDYSGLWRCCASIAWRRGCLKLPEIQVINAWFLQNAQERAGIE